MLKICIRQFLCKSFQSRNNSANNYGKYYRPLIYEYKIGFQIFILVFKGHGTLLKDVSDYLSLSIPNY